MLQLVTADYKPEVEANAIQVLTPRTSLSLIVELSDIGYLDVVETYPVAAEFNKGYLFIAHEKNYTDDGEDMFIVSEFISDSDFRWAPHGEFTSLQEALVEFKRIYAEKLTA